jgi:hypothetical protein
MSKQQQAAAPADITWTGSEAMACALCWAEGSKPEGYASPEAYWAAITPRARMDYRRSANEMRLLAVAKREAVALPAPSQISDERMAMVARYLGLKSRHRVEQIFREVDHALRNAS